jgi:DNA-binding response OmpR family regulator
MPEHREEAGHAADVVVAEDDEFVAELIAATLGARRLKVVVANDGDAALRMCEAYRPRVLVLDIHMPRRSGFEVLRALRRQPGGNRPRVLILTAMGRWEMEEEAMREGADAFMQKPFDPFQLADRVAGLLPGLGQ